jgi:hypothetical protein
MHKILRWFALYLGLALPLLSLAQPPMLSQPTIRVVPKAPAMPGERIVPVPPSLPNVSELLNIRKIDVVFVKVANTDGSDDAAARFSDAQVEQLIRDTNDILIPDARIMLSLKAIRHLKDTRINRLTDWTEEGCPEATQNIATPMGTLINATQHAANNYARDFPKDLVVFMRTKTYRSVMGGDGKPTCKVDDEFGGGFSHKDLEFIALSPWPIVGGKYVAPQAYLAHEFGHFLDLSHTMNNDHPKTVAEARAQLNAYCKAHGATNQVVDLAWNMDGLDDTPGDPGVPLYRLLGGPDEPGRNTSDQPSPDECRGKGWFRVEAKDCMAPMAAGGFRVAPPRDNVMSYFVLCPYQAGNTTGATRARFTPQQKALMLSALSSLRKNLRSPTVGIPIEMHHEKVSPIAVPRPGPQPGPEYLRAPIRF